MASAISPFYEGAIRETGVLDILAPFDPHVVGTLPLGIALPRSDIDIVCHAPDRNAIAQVIWAKFRSADGFALYQWSARGRPLVARFEALGWPFEIFAATEPVEDQAGWRHFRVEQRLLNLAGVALQNQIMAIRMRGLKTEPAFAAVLGLPGDPMTRSARYSGCPTWSWLPCSLRQPINRSNQEFNNQPTKLFHVKQ